MKPKSERGNKELKNPKGSVWKAIKEALSRGANQTPSGTVHVSKTPKTSGLGN